jgi:hypothetical protein
MGFALGRQAAAMEREIPDSAPGSDCAPPPGGQHEWQSSSSLND